MSESSRRPATPAQYIDLGLPIPLSYDADLLSALIQSPFSLHVLWEVSAKTWDAFKRVFARRANEPFHTTLLVRDPEANWRGTYQVGLASSWWLAVYPGRAYEIEVGVTSGDLGFIKLLGPRRVTTPQASVRPVQMDSEQNHFYPPQFQDPRDLVRRLEDRIRAAEIEGLPADLVRVLLKLLRQEIVLDSDWELLPVWLRERLRALASVSDDAGFARALQEYLPDLGIEPLWPDRILLESERSESFHLPGSSEIVARRPEQVGWSPGFAGPSWR